MKEEDMKYLDIIKDAVDSINSFFIQEIDYNCKSELESRLKEYEIIVKNDKNDYRAALVNRKEKKIIINKYYCKDVEGLLFNFVHEILHVLSNKNDPSKKFVEEGIVQLLTYKIMIGKISQEALKKQYDQDGYRVPVAFMDAIYLMNKKNILNYIKDDDGYNELLSNIANIPTLASAILLKNEQCKDLSDNENKKLLKILLKCNYDYSDLCCNSVLIDALSKIDMSEQVLQNMPLVLQTKNKNYKRREIEKKKIYDLFLNEGYEGLKKLNYDFGTYKEYNNDNVWNYLFDIVDEINSSEQYSLFNQNINNQFLSIALAIAFKEKDTDIETQLISLLGIKNASMLSFFSESSNNEVKCLKLDTQGINDILNIFLKNELLTEALVQNSNQNTEEVLLNIVTDIHEEYGVTDYYVLNEIFKIYKNKYESYDNYIEACNSVLIKLGIKQGNVLADPNSVWIQDVSINTENYLKYLASLETKKYYSTRDADYLIQSINYHTLLQQEEDSKEIIEISHDWVDDEGYFNYANNGNIVNMYIDFIEWEYNGIMRVNSGRGQFDKLMKTLGNIRKKSLQQTER